MHSVNSSSCDCKEFQNSNESIHCGFQYTSVYYEEEPSINDYIQPLTIEKPYKCKETGFANRPVEIKEKLATAINLPPLLWHGYDTAPTMLNITNTGRTILINGHWSGGRPYIEGGPLNGTYIFSQIHFHSPSEHEVEGKRYPLEMHVVHYKTSYLTQERAMNEKDGTVVLVYLFEVLDTNPTAMSSVTKLAPQIEKVNSRTETNDVALEQIVQPFSSNYYVYWGSVSSERNSYLLQWIISGCVLCVTSQEADELLGVMNFEKLNMSDLPRMKPQDNIVYYVEEVKFDTKHNEIELLPPDAIVEHSVKDANCEAELTVAPDPTLMEELHQQIHQEVQQQMHSYFCNQAQSSAACEEPIAKKSSKSLSGLRGQLCCRPKDEKNEKIKKKTKCTKTTEVQTETCESGEPEIECKKLKDSDSSKKKKSKDSKKKKKSQKKSCDDEVSSGAETSAKESKESCVCKSPPSKVSCSEEKSKNNCKGVKSPPSSGAESSEKESKEICTCKSSSKEKTSGKKEKSSKKKNKDDKCKPSTGSETSGKNSKESCCCESSSKASGKTGKSSKGKSKGGKSQPSSGAETSEKESKESCVSESPSGKKKASKEKKKSSKEKKKSSKKKSEEEKSQPSSGAETPGQESKDSCTCKSSPKDIKKEKSSNTSECETKKEKKETKNSNFQNENQVECRVAAVSDINFDNILINYENKWLNKNNTSNLENVTSAESSHSNANTYTLGDNFSRSENSTHIKTLFEKKKNQKIPDASNQDTSINFLLPQSVIESRTSTLVMNQIDLEGIKCLVNQSGNTDSKYLNLSINSMQQQQVSGTDLQEEVLGDSIKEFCVQVELVFHSKNNDFSGCSVQEFNLTLLYKQTVLQEYKGTIHPSRLELGNYETLNLVSKYPEIGCMTTRLENCTVKMETLDKISMRAKFLLSAFTPLEFDKEEKNIEVMRNTNLELIDAETQYSRKEITKPEFNIETINLENVSVVDVPEIKGSAELTAKPLPSSSKLSMNILKEKTIDRKNSSGDLLENEILRNSKCKIEIIEKPEVDLGNENLPNTVEQSSNSCKGEETNDKDSAQNPDKELKCIFPNRRKAVFFMCERIEIDKKSGRKIYVGNFRSKDEVKRFYKEKELKNIKKDEEEKLFLLPEKSLAEEIFQVQKPLQDSKSISAESSKTSTEASRTINTLNNTLNRRFGINCFIKDRYNMVVGKPMQLEKESSSFKRLANLIGMDNSKCTNISVYEFPNSKKYPSDSAPTATESKVSKNENPNNACTSSVSNQSVTANNLPNEISKAQTSGYNGPFKHDHKSALLIVPIEVESMSKVEVVLIEHKKSIKKTTKASRTEIIPCLTYS